MLAEVKFRNPPIQSGEQAAVDTASTVANTVGKTTK